MFSSQQKHERKNIMYDNTTVITCVKERYTLWFFIIKPLGHETELLKIANI